MSSNPLLTVTNPSAIPGAPLDLDPMPPIIGRRCNVCQGALAPGQNETCSPDCRNLWRSFCSSMGLPVAKRLLVWQLHRRAKPMPKTARRAFSELTQLGRHNLQRLQTHWRTIDAATHDGDA